MSVLHALPSVPISDLPDDRVRLADLAHLAVLQAGGADTLAFLQGQLTQDIKALADGSARLAGYCTAKGRLLASAVIWQSGAAAEATVSLLVDAGVAPALQKRLTMFVLRSKVKLALATLHAVGVSAGPAALARLEAALGPLPRAAWARTDLPSGTWIAAPQGGEVSRWWWLASPDQLPETLPILAEFSTRTGADAWRADDIAAGIPWVLPTTQDLFVPQTVNLELVGGVSFTKGCYPGQEIVARSHYLGKLKRRMFRGYATGSGIDIAALPATDVFHSQDPSQPSGRVVNAAATADGVALLFESTLASAQGGELHLGAANGPVIALQSLPYSLSEPNG